jgi:hypothetical protein
MLKTKYINNQINPIDVSTYINEFHADWFKYRGKQYVELELQINNDKHTYKFKNTKFIIFEITNKVYVAMTDNKELQSIGFFPFHEYFVNIYNWRYFYSDAALTIKNDSKIWLKNS